MVFMVGQCFTIASVLWLALSIAFGEYFAEWRNHFSSTPVHTERQILTKRDQTILTATNHIISSSMDAEMAVKELKRHDWPDRVLVIFTQQSNSIRSEIYSRGAWTGLTYLSKKGIGYGALMNSDGRKEYIIYEGKAKALNAEMLEYTLYVERAPALQQRVR